MVPFTIRKLKVLNIKQAISLTKSGEIGFLGTIDKYSKSICRVNVQVHLVDPTLSLFSYS
jgi:hypothetical protein